jgi:hypothetical protein
MDFGCWIWMCEYITNEQLFRQLDEPFIPKVNSLSLAAFFCYCFDSKFQAKFTKPYGYPILIPNFLWYFGYEYCVDIHIIPNTQYKSGY